MKGRTPKVFTRTYAGTKLEVDNDIKSDTRGYRRVIKRLERVCSEKGAGDGHIIATVFWEEDPV